MQKVGFSLPSASTATEVKIITFPVTPDGYNQATASVLLVRVPFDDNLAIVFRNVIYKGDGSYKGGANGILNAPGQYFIPINKAIDAADNFNAAHYIVSGGDETNPVVFQSDQVGQNYYTNGNHPTPGVITSTATTHGFTYNDVGQTRQCSNGHTWYLAEMTTNHDLLWLGENISAVEGKYRFLTAADMGSTLTHVANGTHTASYAGFTATDGNIKGWTNGYDELRLYVNNTEVDLWQDNLITDVSGVQLTQTIHYYEPYSVIDFFNANRPVGGYTQWPNVGGDIWDSAYQVYDLQDSLFAVYHKDDFAQDITVLHCGLQQQSWGGNTLFSPHVYRYIPGLLPVSDGTNTFDYRTGVDIQTDVFGAQLMATPDTWEDTPPRREFEVYSGAVKEYDNATPTPNEIYSQDVDFVINFGSLPLYDSADDVAETMDRTFWIQQGGKFSYMVYSHWTSPPTLPAGSTVQAVFVRGTAKKPATAGVINDCRVRLSNGDLWCWMDFDAAGDYDMRRPSGKVATIRSHTTNVSVTGDTITVADADPANIVIIFS
jgi:hypothetical protein